MEIYISNNPSSWKQYGFLAKLSLNCFPTISCECSIFQWLSGVGQKEAICRSEQKGICERMKRGLDFWDGAISLKNYHPDELFSKDTDLEPQICTVCPATATILYLYLWKGTHYCKVFYFGSQTFFLKSVNCKIEQNDNSDGGLTLT